MENAAHQEGYKAHGRGKSREKNPYKEPPIMFVFKQEWYKGWDASQREEDLFREEVFQPKE